VAPAGPTIALAIRGPLTRPDLPGLYARACALLATAPGGVVGCDVAGLPADAVAVDALARLRLAARGTGQRVVLVGASAEMEALIDLAGLAEVLPAAG
jgi:ABC-type transporter Mla MlaB component